MKNIFRLSIRLYGLLLLIGAIASALSTAATGRTPLADPLVLIAPTYNCTTGAITFNTTGGDGSTITYFAPGITGPTTNPSQFVDAGLRQAADAAPLKLSATQSGVTVNYVFDLRATCPVGTTSELPSPIAANVEDQVVRLDQTLTYPAIEIGNRNYNPAISDDYKAWAISAQGLPPGLSLSTSVLMKTFFLVSINGQATQVGIYPVTVKAVNTRAPQNPPFITRFTISVVDSPFFYTLTLTAPTYNCTTGAITFNTAGGNGTPITYFAPGITGPTTNPNQFVDAGLRQAADAQPLTISATQNGATVTYKFDLRATCPIGTTPPTQTNPDRAILVELYNSTNGPGWTNKTNWLQGDSPCGWYGVICDSNGRVDGISLSNNNLTGTLPTSLGNLSQLTNIVLTDNRLSGSIPDSFGNLSQLVNLQISNNQLSGVIPGSLGNLSQLFYFKLNNNLLSGSIPASLKNLSKLYFTDFSDNQLSGSLPSSFGDPRKLQYIFLSNNQLSGCIPPDLATYCINGSLVKIAGNPGLPGGGDFASFCNNRTGACTTTPTTGLALTAPTYNCTTGAFTFNTTGGDGSTITYFAPGITGPTTNPNQFVDAGLRQAADAAPLKLSATQSGIVVTYVFDLRATCPIGTNPPMQPNQDRAALIDLYNSTSGPNWTNKTNWLQGDSPCNWYGVSCDGNGRVTKLGLGYNNLNGTLPASLGNLSRLTELSLGNNNLNGTLPASLGNLLELTFLSLSQNQMSGLIPTTLGNLSQLMRLLLSGNQLSGTIPENLGNLTQLADFQIFENKLTGIIPASLGNMANVEYIILDNNQLSGTIPTSLSSLSKLRYLSLINNQLTGSVPAFLGSLLQLQTLFLDNNQLSGCFPAQLASLCGRTVRMIGNSGLPGGGDFASFCSSRAGACTSTPTTGLTLTAPTYNCTTGAITFNTTGGNGTLIEYAAAGITGWTTNPNQFVDKDSRTANDVQPFTLMARQSGNVVTYTWDLKQACGRARVATEEAGTTLSLLLLGNPVHESVKVLIKGAEGQPVQLRLTDMQGHLLESRNIGQAGTEEIQTFQLAPTTGTEMLLLQATQQQQVRTVKIIRQ